MYYWEINRKFADDYRNVVDGIVAAYPQSAEEIERVWARKSDKNFRFCSISYK